MAFVLIIIVLTHFVDFNYFRVPGMPLVWIRESVVF